MSGEFHEVVEGAGISPLSKAELEIERLRRELAAQAKELKLLRELSDMLLEWLDYDRPTLITRDKLIAKALSTIKARKAQPEQEGK